jgi:glycosyltransferase 2 family protein
VESIEATLTELKTEPVSEYSAALASVEAQAGHDIEIPHKASMFITKLLSLPESVKLKLKIGISLLLFASLFLLGKIDLSKSWEAAKSADLRFLSVAAILFLSSVFLNAYRWSILAKAVGLNRSLMSLTQYCFVGMFFNLFLPSTVGGDVSRCYYLSKGTGHYKDAFYSVLADRASGIAVLFIFACAGVFFGPGGQALPWQLKLPIFVGAFGIFAILPFMPVLTKKLLGEGNWIARQLNQSSANIYWHDKKLIASALFLSMVIQVVIVICHIAVGFALGLSQIPIWYYFVFYPCVAVLGFITPSFNGIGIREWAYTLFLTSVGVDKASALTYAIIWLGLISLSSLVGGLVYVAGHFTAPPKELREDD